MNLLTFLLASLPRVQVNSVSQLLQDLRHVVETDGIAEVDESEHMI